MFALLDRCPHRGGPLSQGIVFGHSVACPLHNWTIELADGCARAPDVGCALTFAVMVEAGQVYLDLGELATRGVEPVAAAATLTTAGAMASTTIPVRPMATGTARHADAVDLPVLRTRLRRSASRVMALPCPPREGEEIARGRVTDVAPPARTAASAAA